MIIILNNDISKKSKLCICNIDEDEKASIYKTNIKEENKIIEIDKEKAQYITNIKKEIKPENNKNITMTLYLNSPDFENHRNWTFYDGND